MAADVGKGPEVKAPTDADWGYAVRFARGGLESYKLPPACLAHLLSAGALEYVDEKPKRSRKDIIESNREYLRRAAEELKAICTEKPNTRAVERLLNQLAEAKEPTLCRKLQVSAKGWKKLAAWGVERPRAGERCSS